mmetsp:Transcript_21128/g.55136  ORF Transcript_21128/g.55136 Transcript_21128/m.55136 type:complete len:255 (-) Transcript_21128:203-967(-)
MERVVPAQLVLRRGQQPVGLDHDDGIRRLHGEDKVVEVELSTNIRELQRRLDHALCAVPVEGHNTCREGAVVRTNPNCSAELLAPLHQGRERLLDVGALVLELLRVVVVDLLEGLPTISKITRVDADLVVGLAGDHGRLAVEVHVRHQRDVHALGVELLPYFQGVFCLSDPLDGEADHVRAGLLAPQDLFDRRLDVVRVRRAHGLEHDGVATPNSHLADFHGARRASLRLFVVGAVAAYRICLFSVRGSIYGRL